MKKVTEDRGGMIIAGCFLIGLAVGFILLETSALYFLGSMLAGLGLGLFASGIIVPCSCKKK